MTTTQPMILLEHYLKRLKLPTIQTKSGADLTVCWDGLMKDLLCHDIQPPNRWHLR